MLVEIRKSLSDLNSKFTVREKTLYEVEQSASHADLSWFRTSQWCHKPLQLEEDCYKVLFLDASLSYESFQFDHMIYSRSPQCSFAEVAS